MTARRSSSSAQAVAQWGPFKRLKTDPNIEAWANPVYIVEVERLGIVAPPNMTPFVHARISRVDLRSAFPRRDVQRIKDELFGTYAEAVELYPARSRLHDASGERHLWILPPGQMFPFGFERPISDADVRQAYDGDPTLIKMLESKIAKEPMMPWHSDAGLEPTGKAPWHTLPALPEHLQANGNTPDPEQN